MALPSDLSLLAYLHDADCNSVCWDCFDHSARRITLLARVDDDIDYEPWKGRNISLIHSDVVACRFIGWGIQFGRERIDSYREGISPALTAECDRLRYSGIDIPPLSFTIIFGSGSTIELVCRELAVEVD